MEDAQIIDLFWQRDESAIKETSNKYGNYCYSIAVNILTNAEDALEIVNDTYLSVWNSIPPHRPVNFSTFLGKITRRIAIDKWRERYAMKRGGGEISLILDELNDCVPSTQSVEHEIEITELAQTINDFVVSMSPIERRVFICRYWYCDSIPAIAQQFGFSQSKVKMILYRQRKRLLTCLEREGLL